MRENWPRAPGLDEAEARKRTLTNLYNKRPEWLRLAHLKLDRALITAYEWPDLNPEGLYALVHPNIGETHEQASARQRVAEEDMLGRVLRLNLERAQSR